MLYSAQSALMNAYDALETEIKCSLMYPGSYTATITIVSGPSGHCCEVFHMVCLSSIKRRSQDKLPYLFVSHIIIEALNTVLWKKSSLLHLSESTTENKTKQKVLK